MPKIYFTARLGLTKEEWFTVDELLKEVRREGLDETSRNELLRFIIRDTLKKREGTKKKFIRFLRKRRAILLTV